jgi:hypothetical protein
MYTDMGDLLLSSTSSTSTTVAVAEHYGFFNNWCFTKTVEILLGQLQLVDAQPNISTVLVMC